MILHSIINFILFQAVWFFALLLEHDSIAPNLIIIGVMLFLSRQLKQDAILVCYGLVIALCFELAMIKLGFLYFKVSPFPLWFGLLWAALLLCLNTSMHFLKNLPLPISIIVCAIFAPASYYAGARFEVLVIDMPLWQFWFFYGVAWSLMFNFLMWLNHKVGRYINRDYVN